MSKPSLADILGGFAQTVKKATGHVITQQEIDGFTNAIRAWEGADDNDSGQDGTNQPSPPAPAAAEVEPEPEKAAA